MIKLLYSGIKIFKYFQISRQNMMERALTFDFPPIFAKILYSSKTFLEVPLQSAN